MSEYEKLYRDAGDFTGLMPPRTAAGKVPTSARLAPGMALMRKARDANGVAADADGAVARASSSSSGAPLPDDVRGRFESSLGADLSGVRVHTGAASAEAASAVGAKAYTVGNDIHFAEGRYAPADPFGIHLLAHEVAHTQQQAGGPKTRQHKLEVSSPGDAVEVEADRAADAMVAGTGVQVRHFGAGPLRRDPDPKYQINDGNYQTVTTAGQEADAEAKASTVDAKGNPIIEGPEVFLGASNKNDRAQAQNLLAHVSAGVCELHMAQAEDPQSEVPGMLRQSLAAQAQLEHYIEASSTQDILQGQFSPELQKTNVQYSRLIGMYEQACASFGVKSESKDFDATRAHDLVVAPGKFEFDVKQQVRDQAVSGDLAHKDSKNSEIAVCKANIATLSREMLKVPAQIGVAVSGLKTSQGAVNAAVAKIRLPPPVTQPTDEQAKLQKNAAAAKAEFDSAVTIMNTAASLAATGISLLPAGAAATGSTQMIDGAGGDPVAHIASSVPASPYAKPVDSAQHGAGVFGHTVQGGVEDVPGMKGSANDATALGIAQKALAQGSNFKIETATPDVKFSFVEGVADVMTQYSAKVASANGMIAAISDANTKASMEAAIATMNAARDELNDKLKELRRLRTEFELAKTLIRTEADKLMTLVRGNQTQGGKGPDFGVAIAFQTESTIYMAQVDTTLQIGKVEREAARGVNANVKLPAGTAVPTAKGITSSEQHGAPYWAASRGTRPDKPSMPLWSYIRNKVFITEQGTGTQREMDLKMDELMKQLETSKTNVQGFRSKLSELTGI
jgi:hypothetical protein